MKAKLQNRVRVCLVMFCGLFYRSERYKHLARVISRMKVHLRHDLCKRHVRVQEILRKENGEWVRYKYVTVDGLIIDTYCGDMFIDDLRERYYKLHKHELLEMQLYT